MIAATVHGDYSTVISEHFNNGIAQRIFKYSDIQYTSLTPNKIMNSLIYRTLFYVNIYGSYKLSKNSPVFWPTLYTMACGYDKTVLLTDTEAVEISSSVNDPQSFAADFMRFNNCLSLHHSIC